MLYGLRQLERWLHQHLFKVGWLVTKKLQTTTILYYAFFLPGIFLHQFTYWLAAGFLNVRADRTIKWPEKQEIGELKLSFVQLARSAGPVRRAIISTAPFVVGLLAVGFIANNVLAIHDFLTLMSNGFLGDVSSAVNKLTSTPDFWIWFYLLVTISNTMMPNPKDLKGWWMVISILVVAVVVLFVIGAGSEVLSVTLTGPIADGLNVLAGTLGVVIGVDLFMVAVLGTIEAIIERITGNSATFKNGKMITLRREEMLAQRAQQMRRTPKETKAAVPSGPPSVYKLTLPIPGGPGKEATTRGENLIVEPEPRPALPGSPVNTGRAGPALITGSASEKPASLPPTPPQTSTTASPLAALPQKAQAGDDSDEEDYDEDDDEESV